MPEEDLTQPPETPPGDPSLEDSTTSDSTAAPASPPGSQAGTTPPPASQPVFSADQISALATGISDGLVKGLKPAEPPPQTMNGPTGPSIVDLEGKKRQLDQQIDLAVQEGKSYNETQPLREQRDGLLEQIFEIKHVAPLRQQGGNSINALTLDTVRKADPYFIKYEKEVMALLNPAIAQGQVLNLELVQGALSLVKGQHVMEIVADEKEKETRQAKLQQQTVMPGATSGRARTTQPAPPATIKDRFGANADEAFQSKRAKGYTEDTFARRQGFKDKADWFARDHAMSQPDFTIGLDSVWDKKNQRWVQPDELNEFYNG